MKNIKIRKSLAAGWSAFMRRPWYLMGLAIAFSFIFIFSLGNAMVTALAYIAYGGCLAMLINHFRGGQIVFDDMFSLDNRWISFAFLGIIKTSLIFLGLIFFVIPGLYLATRWMFAELLVIDQGLKPLEALRASSKMTEGVRWKLFFFIVVVGILCLLGLVALIVGALVMSIVATFALIQIYEELKDVAEKE